MPSLSIVKNLNVFKNDLLGLHSCFVIFVINQFVFQCAKETLGNCIIQTFTLTTHAATKPWMQCRNGTVDTVNRLTLYNFHPYFKKLG